MATKKNPLSALLSADKRQQAEDFTRDHVTRSAVRQAGTYRVGVQQPLPITQTSLGRLSNSLGTVSGILNQFSQYQSKKEQAELKGESIETQTTLQGFATEQAKMDLTGAHIQGGIAHEAVKRQNIQLATMQQKASDAEYDNMRARMSIEEGKAHDARIVEDVRLTKRAQKAAELALVTGFPADFVHTPEFDKRARQGMGAAYYDEYKSYFATKIEEAVKGLPDHARAAYLKGPEAVAMMEGILTQFMEEKGLTPNDEIGDGFLSSVQSFNKANIPHGSSILMAKSRELAMEQVQKGLIDYPSLMGDAAASGDEIRLKEQDFYMNLSGMKSEDKEATLFDQKTGAFALMGHTYEGAVKAQMVFNELADTLLIGGKPMREHVRFMGWQADIEEAIENAAIAEVNKEENVYKLALRDTGNALVQLGHDLPERERSHLATNLVRVDDTTPELRARLEERFPSLIEYINQVPDDMLVTYANEIVLRINRIGDAADAMTDGVISTAMVGFQRADDGGPGSVMALQFVQDRLDLNTPETAAVSALVGGEIQKVMGGEGISELNEAMGGAFGDYKDELTGLKSKVEATLEDGASSEEFNAAYGEALKEVQARFHNKLTKHFTGHIIENNTFLAALGQSIDVYDDPDTEKVETKEDGAELVAAGDKGKALRKLGRKEGWGRALDALLLDPEFIYKTLKDHPDMNYDGAIKMADHHKKTHKNIPLETLAITKAKTAEIARLVENSRTARKAATKKLKDVWTQPGGKGYEQIQALVSNVANKRKPGLLDGNIQNLNQRIDAANTALKEYYAAGVTTDEIKDIAASAYSRTQAPPSIFTVPTSIVIKSVDDYLQPKAYNVAHPELLWAKTDETRGVLKMDVDGKPLTHETWPENRRDLEIPGGWLMKKQPPVTGLPFGSSPPATQKDVDDIARTVGWSKIDLKKISFVYGHKDPLTFLKAVYNNTYYHNRRVRGTTLTPVAPVAPVTPVTPVTPDSYIP